MIRALSTIAPRLLTRASAIVLTLVLGAQLMGTLAVAAPRNNENSAYASASPAAPLAPVTPTGIQARVPAGRIIVWERYSFTRTAFQNRVYDPRVYRGRPRQGWAFTVHPDIPLAVPETSQVLVEEPRLVTRAGNGGLDVFLAGPILRWVGRVRPDNALDLSPAVRDLARPGKLLHDAQGQSIRRRIPATLAMPLGLEDATLLIRDQIIILSPSGTPRRDITLILDTRDEPAMRLHLARGGMSVPAFYAAYTDREILRRMSRHPGRAIARNQIAFPVAVLRPDTDLVEISNIGVTLTLRGLEHLGVGIDAAIGLDPEPDPRMAAGDPIP